MRACGGATLAAVLVACALTALMVETLFGTFLTVGLAGDVPHGSRTDRGPMQGEAGQPHSSYAVHDWQARGYEGQGEQAMAGRHSGGPQGKGVANGNTQGFEFSMLSLDGPSTVDAPSCSEPSGVPAAFCKRAVPALALWALALPMAWLSTLGALTRGTSPSCLSEASRLRAIGAFAALGFLAMIASIATLASASDDIKAEISAASPEGRPTGVEVIEVSYGWAAYASFICAGLQLAVCLAFAYTSFRRHRREGAEDGEPMPAKGSSMYLANMDVVVVGQPVSDGGAVAGGV